MDTLAYCQHKAAPPGSAGYYGVLLLPPAARAGVLGLLALECELDEVVEHCSERTVAEHKLAWWHEELALASDARARHPVTACLHEHAPGALTPPDAQALLAGVHHRIVHAQFRDAAALDASCRDTAGIIGHACARALAGQPAIRADELSAVFVACERLRLLCLPWRAGLPPHTGVALDMLTAAGARPEDIDRGGDSPAAQRLRAQLLAGARDALQHALECLPGARGFAATRAHIARAQLRALARGGYAATGAARPALPITLLWLAWRHRPRPSATQ